MELSKVHTDKAPAAVGPYSQAIAVGDFIFCSGQVAIDQTGKITADDVQGQTQQALHNLRAVLQAAGSDLNRVVKTTVFLADMETFQAMNQVYATFFGDIPPARATIAVKALPLDALVEIEAVAVKG
jgi:2-iminobutanoate/2-iminopropanoate deaminase